MQISQHSLHTFVVYLSLLPFAACVSWSYSGISGPANWADRYQFCNGSKQSPINIDPVHVTKDGNLGPFSLVNFTQPIGLNEGELTNNGHSIAINFNTSPANLAFSGGGLAHTYVLQNIHFHWGVSDMDGSEHTINGMAYPMEAHFVTKTSEYADPTIHSDGYAVLGFFFEIGTHNTAWDPIISRLTNVTPNQAAVLPSNVVLSSLLPGDLDDYYRYEGSLTTPSCDEMVAWTLFKETIKISTAQMAEFRNHTGGSGVNLSGNFRPVQSLGQRTVYVSTSSGHALSTTSGFLGCVTLLWTTISMFYQIQKL